MKKIFLVILLATVLQPGVSSAQTTSSTPVSVEASHTTANVPILIYHSVRPYYPGITKIVKEYTVPPDIFDDQMKYLRDNGYTAITMDDLMNYFSFGTKLPEKPVVVTLDDGWENQYRYAYPILQKYNYPAVFFIYPGAVNAKHFLTWDEVNTMVSNNMIIGDHTYSHPELPKVTDATALNKEIVVSRQVIQDHIHKIVKDFAYPFGAYEKKDIDLVKQAGYQSARTVFSGTKQTTNILFTLRGIIVTGDFNRFVSMLNK